MENQNQNSVVKDAMIAYDWKNIDLFKANIVKE